MSSRLKRRNVVGLLLQGEVGSWIQPKGNPWVLIKGLELAKEYGVRKVSVEGWTKAQFQNLLSSLPSLLTYG